MKSVTLLPRLELYQIQGSVCSSLLPHSQMLIDGEVVISYAKHNWKAEDTVITLKEQITNPCTLRSAICSKE